VSTADNVDDSDEAFFAAEALWTEVLADPRIVQALARFQATDVRGESDRTRAQNVNFARLYGGTPIPPICQYQVQTEGPAVEISWMRQVDSIDRHETGMAQFSGIYLHPPVGQTHYWVQPGTLCIVAIPRRRSQVQAQTRYPEHDLQLYIFLPDDIWYLLPDGELHQRIGWHEHAAQVLQTWIQLPRGIRVATALRAAYVELETTLETVRNGTDVTEFAATEAALTHLHDLLDAVENAVPFTPPLQADAVERIRNNFRLWVEANAQSFDTTLDTVRGIARAELGVAPITTSGDKPASTLRRSAVENRQRRNIRISRRSE
jgi:hypothetical protein